MPKIVIYSTTLCPYCTMAKNLLVRKGAVFQEIRVDRSPEMRREMMDRSRRHTVPQIFIDNRPIGGFDQLYALDQAGRLEAMLTFGGEVESP